MRTKPIIALIAITLSGCSSVETHKAAVSLSTINSFEHLQLMVRTGNPAMDQLLYELAFQQFGSLLPLTEKEPYTGTMEISFLSSGQSAFVGSSSTIGSATAYGSGWYNGAGYVGGTSTVTGSSSTISSGGTFTWQNSNMMITIKKTNGERIWTADYSYKGGWELSGWVVNTPEEAARLVLKRLKSKFEDDFNRG